MKKLLLGLSLAPLTLGLVSSAQAQVHHHHHILRHLAAGVAGYEVAKHTGNRREAAGGHRNFLQRHPVLSGVGAYTLSKHHPHLFHHNR